MNVKNTWYAVLLGLVMVTAVVAGSTFAQDEEAVPDFTEVTFKASDDLEITADFYGADSDGSAPLLLLFHQAGSSRGEYRSIAPRLTAIGYHCLAIDQRSGKQDRWNQVDNKTAARAKEQGLAQTYLDAYPDMEAAVEWAKEEGYKTIGISIWGSSYSSALVFKLASEHADDLKTMLSFSPGEYIKGESVSGWAETVELPTFVTCGEKEGEEARAKTVFDTVKSDSKTFVTSKGGHGSSVLMDEEENWGAVELFLNIEFPIPVAGGG